MTDKLPPPLLALFQPRPPLRYVTPINRAPEDVKKSTISGIAQYLPEIKKYEEEIPYTATESWIQRKWREKLQKKERVHNQLNEALQECIIWDLALCFCCRHANTSSVDPSKDPQARGDPFKTLFVARLSYDVKESDLEREFGRFGPIERVYCFRHSSRTKGC